VGVAVGGCVMMKAKDTRFRTFMAYELRKAASFVRSNWLLFTPVFLTVIIISVFVAISEPWLIFGWYICVMLTLVVQCLHGYIESHYKRWKQEQEVA
jgi:hypothetical protein